MVLHHCDNPPCCNPAHLFEGTNEDNIRDAAQKGRMRRKLSDNDVREIQRRLRKGDLQEAIAADFDVSQVCVSHIKLGKIWRWIYAA